jgi:hypothetical protein
MDQARKLGQSLGPVAADGSFAAGVKHVTELLPSLMTDIINSAPEQQKVRFLDITYHYKAPSICACPLQIAKRLSIICTRSKIMLFVFLNSRIACVLGQNSEAH